MQTRLVTFTHEHSSVLKRCKRLAVYAHHMNLSPRNLVLCGFSNFANIFNYIFSFSPKLTISNIIAVSIASFISTKKEEKISTAAVGSFTLQRCHSLHSKSKITRTTIDGQWAGCNNTLCHWCESTSAHNKRALFICCQMCRSVAYLSHLKLSIIKKIHKTHTNPHAHTHANTLYKNVLYTIQWTSEICHLFLNTSVPALQLHSNNEWIGRRSASTNGSLDQEQCGIFVKYHWCDRRGAQPLT